MKYLRLLYDDCQQSLKLTQRLPHPQIHTHPRPHPESQDYKPQLEMPKEEDLNNWSHHFGTDTINDSYLRKATQGTDLVSFVFGLEVGREGRGGGLRLA